MSTHPSPSPVSKKLLWTGLVLSVLPSLLLIFSAIMKLAKPPAVVEGFAHFGYPLSVIPAIGIVQLACTFIYLVPRTSILGAILLTGYLGGATATNVRVGDTWIPTVILGVLVWGGLFLREPRLRALMPLRR